MGWRLLRADRLHFMTCSHRRSTAPRSGLRLHCDEKPCAPGERLPLKRRDRCLHSGKKTQTYLFYLTDPVWLQSHRNIRRAGDVRLKPRVVILRRHSSCHLIFYLHEVGEVGPVRVLRIEISCTWTRGVFFFSYISWQRRFSCSSFILRVFGAHAFHCARSAPPSTYNKQRNVFLLQPSSHQPWRCSHLPTNTIHSAFFFLLKRKENVSIIPRSRSCFRYCHSGAGAQ